MAVTGWAAVMAALAVAAGEPEVAGEGGATAKGGATATPAPTPTADADADATPTSTPTATADASPTASTSTTTTTSTSGTETASETETPIEVEAEVAAATAPPVAEPAPAGPFLADGSALVLARHVWADGGALERLLEPSGDIVLHAVNRAGTVESCTKVGSLFALQIVEQRDAAGGEVVHVVDDESGARLRYVVAADGEPRAVELLAPAPVASAR